MPESTTVLIQSYVLVRKFQFSPYQSPADQYEERLFEINFNAHYIFELTHRFGTYPLVGLSYTTEEGRSTVDLNDTDQHSAPGINFGLGTHYGIRNILLFAEFKGVIGELNDEFFTLGAVIHFKRPQKKQQHQD